MTDRELSRTDIVVSWLWLLLALGTSVPTGILLWVALAVGGLTRSFTPLWLWVIILGAQVLLGAYVFYAFMRYERRGPLGLASVFGVGLIVAYAVLFVFMPGLVTTWLVIPVGALAIMCLISGVIVLRSARP